MVRASSHRAAVVASTWVFAVACGGNSPADPDAAPAGIDAAVDAAPAPDADPLAPESLRDTGLYSDFAAETLASGVLEYQPQGELWSDGATKRRWVLLPTGTAIDTSDMDFWVYPEGTKLWKEFTRDGIRIETRLLWKQGPTSSDWYSMAYVWNEDQTDAVAAPLGVVDAKGTQHDVPDQNTCRKCHSRQPDQVLGFSAIQLDHGLAGVTLDSLKVAGSLSVPPIGSAPYFALPGDDVIVRPALRYFHANCGGCHHEQSDVMANTNINLRLSVAGLATPQDTAIYQTTINVDPQLAIGPDMPKLVVPADPAASNVHIRMNSRTGTDLDMPQEGSELVDTAGLAIIDQWISSL